MTGFHVNCSETLFVKTALYFFLCVFKPQNSLTVANHLSLVNVIKLLIFTITNCHSKSFTSINMTDKILRDNARQESGF